MERIQSINPMRVQWCCDDRGLTPEELAESVGIPLTNVQRVMSGEDALTFNQLRKIAQFFNRGVLFFLEQDPVNEQQIHTPQFRIITNQAPDLDAKIRTLIERVEKQRAVYISLREDLGEAELDLFAPPVLPANNPKRAAEISREWLGLGANNDFESYRHAVEARGILVFRTNGYNGPWQISKESPVIGFSLFEKNYPAIVVKKQTFANRQTFTLMHELAHVLLHQSSFVDHESDLYSALGNEREANEFAGYLLVPDSFLTAIDDGQRPRSVDQYDEWLRPWVKIWGVSTEVILRRLLDTGRLSQANYGAFRDWISQISLIDTGTGSREYRYREPKHIFGEPFVRTVLDALSAKHISLAKASTFLDNLKIKDVHQLEQYVASH